MIGFNHLTMQSLHQPEIIIEETRGFTHYGIEPLPITQDTSAPLIEPPIQPKHISEPTQVEEMEMESIVKKKKLKMKKHKLRKARKRQRFLRRRLGKVG